MGCRQSSAAKSTKAEEKKKSVGFDTARDVEVPAKRVSFFLSRSSRASSRASTKSRDSETSGSRARASVVHDPNRKAELSQHLLAAVKSLFDKLDIDKDGHVTLDEAKAHWAKNYAKLNATAMFNEVDTDESGTITFEEWIGFWENVINSGYEEEYVLEELAEMLKKGSAWTDFDDQRSTTAGAGTINKKKEYV